MLQIFAYIFMFIDHIFKFLQIKGFTNTNPIIGTLSFPIFAYLVATSLKRTKNKDKYLMRLLIFAFVSQIPMILMVFGTPNTKSVVKLTDKIIYLFLFFTQKLNIGFTLTLGVLSIKMMEKNKDNFLNKMIFLLIFLIISVLLNVDYGLYGVALIVVFYYIKKLPYLFLIIVLLNAVNFVVNYVYGNINRETLVVMNMHILYGILALPFIYLLGIRMEEINKAKIKKEKKLKTTENNNKKKILRILKYSIYPVHMLAIYLFNYFNVFM